TFTPLASGVGAPSIARPLASSTYCLRRPRGRPLLPNHSRPPGPRATRGPGARFRFMAQGVEHRPPGPLPQLTWDDVDRFFAAWADRVCGRLARARRGDLR